MGASGWSEAREQRMRWRGGGGGPDGWRQQMCVQVPAQKKCSLLGPQPCSQWPRKPDPKLIMSRNSSRLTSLLGGVP